MQKLFKTIPLLTLSLLFFLANGCRSQTPQLSEIPRQGFELLTPRKESLRLRLALTDEENTQGLSGLPSQDFQTNDAMLFVYTEDGNRKFWMPDTYFSLDIFFLDAQLKVIDVDRDVPSHPGRNIPPEIATTRSIYSRHVLELRSDSSLAKAIQIGETLTLRGPYTFEQILSALQTSEASRRGL